MFRSTATGLRTLAYPSQDIGTALRIMVGGDTEVSQFRDPQTNENYDVQLRLDVADRSDASQIPQMFLAGKNDQLVELRSIRDGSAGHLACEN